MRFKQDIKVTLSPSQLNKAREMVNLHYLGDKEANKPKEGSNYFEAKYPEKETDEFREAHWRLTAGSYVTVKLEIGTNGNITLAL